MKTKIVIVGMGNMGKRHLQAITSLSSPLEIICYDISKMALESVFGFCDQSGISTKNIRLCDDYREMIDCISGDTVVVLAATASGRARVLKEIIGQKPIAILAEKPLCQSLAEYDRLLELAKENQVPIYLNFSRHMYPFYQEINNSLNKIEKISFNATFPNGLACIGIHMFELMTWLTATKSYQIVEAKLVEIFDTKRSGYQDFFGGLIVEIEGRAQCSFSSLREDISAVIEIKSTGRSYIVDEINKTLEIIEISGKKSSRDIKILYTSQISDKVVGDLISQGATDKLPDIFQSYLAHKILFDYMKLVGREDINVT